MVFIPQKSFAACGLTITASDVTINWDFNFTYIAVQVQVDKAGPAGCKFGIGLTKGGAASYAARRGSDGGNLIDYQLYKENALSLILKDVPDLLTDDDVVKGGFNGGTNQTQTVNYYFEIPYDAATAPSLVAAGTYTDAFTMNIYEGNVPSGYVTPVDSQVINVTINVPTMIGLSVIDSGGGYVDGQLTRNISFGTLSEGQSSAHDIRVRTNAGFDVTFSSANNGYLNHDDVTKNSQVPYKFYVNAGLLDMSNSAAVPVSGVTAAGQTSLSGLAYPVKIVIGNVLSSGKMGGAHSDVVTITATTTE